MLSRLSLVSSPISDFLMISVAVSISRSPNESAAEKRASSSFTDTRSAVRTPTGQPRPNRPSGPRMKGKGIEKKRYVGLPYTETRRRQLYLVATHRNRSPGDYIRDIIHDHVRADPTDLQRNLNDLIR